MSKLGYFTSDPIETSGAVVSIVVASFHENQIYYLQIQFGKTCEIYQMPRVNVRSVLRLPQKYVKFQK